MHGWEALLAISTIAIWHLYHALWRPGGPNWSWVTGCLTVEQLAHEHPGQFEGLLARVQTPEKGPRGHAVQGQAESS